MPKTKKRTTRKRKKPTSAGKDNAHVLYGCLVIIAGVVVGAIIFGVIMS